MIHYFNPGHEVAVLTDSPFYQPPATVVKMQEDLAFLPFWYADPGDFICVPKPLSAEFEPLCNASNIHVAMTCRQFLKDQKVDFWGLSKQAIHTFENYSKQYDLSLDLPEWKDEYRKLSSRELAADCLSSLAKEIPDISKDIIPSFFSDLSEIEEYNRLSPDKLLAKSPYSSSGRGLLWLEHPSLSRSSRQIIQGMLNKQKKVSLEKALEKVLDFSMHFSQDAFIGYSVFYTNPKGAYEKTWLASQEKMESRLTQYVSPELLVKVRRFLLRFIKERIAPYYQGNIGIDMMVFRSGGKYHLHPCVEINLRKSMGYLSLRLYQNYMHPTSEGYFSVVYNSDMTSQAPTLSDDGKLKSGAMDLCPVNVDTKYRAVLYLTHI